MIAAHFLNLNCQANAFKIENCNLTLYFVTFVTFCVLFILLYYHCYLYYGE